MVDFQFTEMFPQSKGDTPFRKLTDDFVTVGEHRGHRNRAVACGHQRYRGGY